MERQIERNIEEIVNRLGTMEAVLALYKDNDKVSKYAIRYAKKQFKTKARKITRRAK
jgi:hypothetical protein